jgi:hypothetical protein
VKTSMTQVRLILAYIQTRSSPRMWLSHVQAKTFPSGAVPVVSVLLEPCVL